MTEVTKKFAKTAHLFAHRKTGAQKRFEKVYSDLAERVKLSWTADLSRMEQEFSFMSKSNQALAATKKERNMSMAEDQIKKIMRTVFEEWRAEVNRIVSDLSGYPQEDGNVLFPDGSVARMPKGLFIPKENQLSFE